MTPPPQSLGDGEYRVTGVPIDPFTGRYLTSKEREARSAMEAHAHRVEALAKALGKTLIPRRHSGGRAFVLVNDTPEDKVAGFRLINRHPAPETLPDLDQIETQLKAEIQQRIRDDAEAWADEIVWRVDDTAVISENQLVELITRVITHERTRAS